MCEDERVVLSLLDDEYAREILKETSVEPLSAKALTERCDASPPTIYRRLDRLQEQDLIVERQRIASDGNHHAVYTATFERAVVELESGDLAVDVFVRDDPADQFTHLFEELR
ncbi:helix-turn-helix domain-containing protein [Salarchaeum japonicum]|uniref:helix-turn-helix domain-containing protein n=1 Tax=Salarchaeum japonicum TaxID=555573 RepID=UPI003C71491B